jgi:short-subunit dehydrogenase
MRRAEQPVVVITGASSGLGRATAMELAPRGARLALAARRSAALGEVAAACRERGGEAIPVPTDVTREDEVDRLRDTALRSWGRIDVWINNAGVSAFGRLNDVPYEIHRRVIETNLCGAVLCARAVVPVFRRQRRGILINVGSVLSKIGQAFVPSYVISKFGLRGLSEALRAELADDADIHVCTLLPYAIDTPHFQSGANAVGRAAHAMPPVQTPEHVARELVRLIDRPRRERHVPAYTRVGLAFHELFPRLAERLLLHALERFHFGAPQAITDGGLFEPVREPGRIHGSRRPTVSVPAFLAWSVRELVRLELSWLRDRAERWPPPRTMP